MDLQTGKFFWPHTYSDPPAYPSLETDIECEVLIIGGGVSGCMVAHYLMESGINSVIVDKRSIGMGSTYGNTGLLQLINDKSLLSLVHTFGEDKAVRHYKLCLQAIDCLAQLVSTLDSNPDFRRRSSLYYATTPSDEPSLLTEFQTLQKYDFPVQFFTANDIRKKYQFSKVAAIYTSGDAEVNPYKLVHAIAKKAIDKGLKIYEKTEIINHIQKGEHLYFKIKNGKTIKTKKVVFATGYETQQIKRNPNVRLVSTYAIVTQPINELIGWDVRDLIWETARPYLYFRTTVENRIIAGGLDEETIDPIKRDSKLIGKTKTLLNEIRNLFPFLSNLKVEYKWGATFGTTADGLPLIGTQQGFPNCYFILNYGGNGTVTSVIASQIIHDLITKGYHPDMDLYQFDRGKYLSSK
ncbi:FAD-binding oxidoreductase [Bacillus sp. FJAT-29790]|uniref:NAD(P)/FAD-dependent oxidoreductase n=1 Tax=Bacillus sp. FJAT-29790 TaxID=1895002 RepID=UPI001C240821|nr:FAD-binding oxidoreductase [Bacillus sp. FJAT-29790]